MMLATSALFNLTPYEIVPLTVCCNLETTLNDLTAARCIITRFMMFTCRGVATRPS